MRVHSQLNMDDTNHTDSSDMEDWGIGSDTEDGDVASVTDDGGVVILPTENIDNEGVQGVIAWTSESLTPSPTVLPA